MIEAAFMVVGVLLFGAGWVTGRLARLRSRPAPIRPICECGHHHGTHADGGCNAQVKTPVYGHGYEWCRCACVRYTGPVPLDMVWAPPIATSD